MLEPASLVYKQTKKYDIIRIILIRKTCHLLKEKRL